jgi:hypothetical protein
MYTGNIQPPPGQPCPRCRRYTLFDGVCNNPDCHLNRTDTPQKGRPARLSATLPARLSATLLGAVIAEVQVWALCMFCTFGAFPVGLASEGGTGLAITITGFGIVIGGIVGCIAAPPIWTGRNTLKLAAIIFGSIVLAGVGLMMIEIALDVAMGGRR